ncbi:DUF2589 domain-containing protein [Prevotella merdae]|uniref:DUF2589 domain-containing protein n=1 Tax=Prevotella merdae TaxID=2079531 RepID=UPI00356B0AD9
MEEKQNTQVSSHIMELKDLISGPLVATIDADSLSARRYLNYLFELAFESYDKTTGKVGKIRTLDFTYKSSDVSGKRTQRISLPILTLVPLPLLQVKEADFDFDIQIIDAVSQDKNATFSLSGDNSTEKSEGVKLRVSMAPSSGEGSLGSKSQSSLTANMRVKVKMEQADMPGGLSNLLQLATNNLQIEEVDDDTEE